MRPGCSHHHLIPFLHRHIVAYRQRSVAPSSATAPSPSSLTLVASKAAVSCHPPTTPSLHVLLFDSSTPHLIITFDATICCNTLHRSSYRHLHPLQDCVPASDSIASCSQPCRGSSLRAAPPRARSQSHPRSPVLLLALLSTSPCVPFCHHLSLTLPLFPPHHSTTPKLAVHSPTRFTECLLPQIMSPLRLVRATLSEIVSLAEHRHPTIECHRAITPKQ